MTRLFFLSSVKYFPTLTWSDQKHQMTQWADLYYMVPVYYFLKSDPKTKWPNDLGLFSRFWILFSNLNLKWPQTPNDSVTQCPMITWSYPKHQLTQWLKHQMTQWADLYYMVPLNFNLKWPQTPNDSVTSITVLYISLSNDNAKGPKTPNDPKTLDVFFSVLSSIYYFQTLTWIGTKHQMTQWPGTFITDQDIFFLV